MFLKGVDKENLYKLLLRSSRPNQEGSNLKLRNVVHIFTLRFNKIALYVLSVLQSLQKNRLFCLVEMMFYCCSHEHLSKMFSSNSFCGLEKENISRNTSWIGCIEMHKNLKVSKQFLSSNAPAYLRRCIVMQQQK